MSSATDKTVTVVGSGASAVQFARSALDQGWRVRMLDVGRPRPAPVMPQASFLELIERHEDPTRYFMGERFQSLLFPGAANEFYGFPPHREYIFEGLEQYPLQSKGFDPLQSFARGGLAEAWTAGCFPFNDLELEDFPWGYDEIGPFYDRVSQRIGIIGADDDLGQFFPVHGALSEPIELDAHAQKLVARYQAKRAALNASGVYLGRSRSAVLVEDRGDRKACNKLGRCLWGCPREALYTPALTLRELERDERFEYRGGVFVSHFEADDGGRVHHVVVEPVDGGAPERLPVERLVLGAGTLASSKIFLDSVYRATGELWTLDGLMDNRQVLVPFLNLGMIGKPYVPESYQYHQLCMGFTNDPAKHYVHGILTTLKTTMMHPIVQNVPLDLRAALDVFRNVHAALGLLNVNFHDTRRPENQLALEPTPEGRTRLLVRYVPLDDEPAYMKRSLSRVKGALLKLGCIVPPGMAHERPMGASVHYAGTLPMSAEPKSKTTDPNGRSHDFENLWFVDGTSFPFLPAKNLTFSLMANASRIAARNFD